MALTQLFPLTLISARVGPVVKRWPLGAEKIRFQLDDSQFTDPALSVVILIQCSWNGQNGPWHWGDPNPWRGGDKARDGSAPSVILGPFKRAGPTPGSVIVDNPTHVRFFAQPGPGSDPVAVGLLAEITEL